MNCSPPQIDASALKILALSSRRSLTFIDGADVRDSRGRLSPAFRCRLRKAATRRTAIVLRGYVNILPILDEKVVPMVFVALSLVRDESSTDDDLAESALIPGAVPCWRKLTVGTDHACGTNNTTQHNTSRRDIIRLLQTATTACTRCDRRVRKVHRQWSKVHKLFTKFGVCLVWSERERERI